TNVDLIYVEGFETIAEERTILPEVKCMLMCKFGLGNNVSFFSSFGTDSFIVRSDVAPEKYSLMFLLDFGISIVLQ
ncbi:MAG TPA: hypothetical protein PKW61_09450, partial [Tenuifilaceae bacterium]|nr:hypothetical protein [Tenuifilaceae bacterium]